MSYIQIKAKCSLDDVCDYIEPDKVYNLYYVTSINNNNDKGNQSFKIKNSITYIKKSRLIKKSLIFENEQGEVVIPDIDYQIRYLLLEEL